MRVKQLLDKLQQENFDVEHFDITVDIGDDEAALVTDFRLDDDTKQLRLSLDAE